VVCAPTLRLAPDNPPAAPSARPVSTLVTALALTKRAKRGTGRACSFLSLVCTLPRKLTHLNDGLMA